MSDICPREIRNAVAHQDFKIESNGTVYMIRGRKTKRFSNKDLIEKIENAIRLIELFAEMK